MTEKIRVTSEIGRLRKVIVHAPGPELLAVTPGNAHEYLYDDVVDLELARQEHARFVAILGQFCEVLPVRALLHQTLASPVAREFLITRSEEVTADRSLRDNLGSVLPDVLIDRFIEGWQMPTGPFSTKLEKQSYLLPPLPNLFFTRDSAVVVGSGVSISAMRFLPRWPEEALMRTIFGFHPLYGGVPIYYDGSDERRYGYSIEGGDIHCLSEDTLLIGISERTTAAAVDMLCEYWFTQSKISNVIALILPERSNAIHLDMVWTQLSRDLCAVHPPMFRGLGKVPVLFRRRGEVSVREPDNLFAALNEVDIKLEPVYCGGPRVEIQEREQWASGCNFLAVAPGQVMAYDRNHATLRAMEEAGFSIIAGEDLLRQRTSLALDEQAVITFAGAELVRGGGGPRCMTCPILRDEP